jgi:hypothetical protein
MHVHTDRMHVHTGRMVQIRVELTCIPKNYYFIKIETQKHLVIAFCFICFTFITKNQNKPPFFIYLYI